MLLTREADIPSIEEVIHLPIPDELRGWDNMRAEANRGTQLVGFSNSDSVRARSNETKRVATGGLTGCMAVAAVIETPRWREAHIQHYRTYQESRLTVGCLRTYLESLDDTEIVAARMVIMAPMDFYSLRPLGISTISRLTQLVSQMPIEPTVNTVVCSQYHKENDKLVRRSYSLLAELLDDGTTSISTESGVIPVDLPNEPSESFHLLDKKTLTLL